MSTQATKNKKNEAVSAVVGNNDANERVGKSIENLSTIANLAKKSKLTKPKKAGLSNTKANSGTDFLTSGVKKAFIH